MEAPSEEYYKRLKLAVAKLDEGTRIVAQQTARTNFKYRVVPVNELVSLTSENKRLFEHIAGDRPRKAYFDYDLLDRPACDQHLILEEAKSHIIKNFGDVEMAISGSVGMCPVKGKIKHSWHIVLPGVVYRNAKEQRDCVLDFVKRTPGFDDCVYGTNQLMKLPNQSKINDSRIQRVVENENMEDHFVSAFLREDARTITAVMQDDGVPATNNQHVQRTPVQVDLSALKPVDFIVDIPEGWSIHTSPGVVTLSLIFHDRDAHRLSFQARYTIMRWAQQQGVSFDEFLAFMKPGRILDDDKVKKYDYQWNRECGFKVNDLTILAILQTIHPNISFKRTPLDKHKWYHCVKPDSFIKTSRQFTLEDYKDIPEFLNHPRAFVRAEDLSHSRVNAWFIKMGGGKTHAMLKIIRDLVQNRKRVLIVTCRRTLVADISGRANGEDLFPTVYLNREDKATLQNDDFLVINGESLRYLKGAKPYDCVFIDEYESFVNSWLSHGTHGHRLKDNWEAFCHVYTSANKVVLMDAFLTQKTLKICQQLGDKVHVLGSRQKPHERVMKYMQFPKTRQGGSTNEERLNCVLDLVIKDIRDGKNIVVFYPVAQGSERTKPILAVRNTICEATGLSHEECGVYFSDNKKDMRDLQDPKRSFQQKRLILSTSVITVGVSYDLPTFHKMYVMRACYVNIRDIIQFTYRWRQLLDDEVITCELLAKPGEVVLAGNSSRMRSALHLGAFQEVERWVEYEKTSFSEEIFRHYSGLAGYKWFDVDHKGQPITEQTKKYIEKYTYEWEAQEDATWNWDNIADINQERVSFIRQQQKVNGTEITLHDVVAAKKYYFRSLLSGGPEATLKKMWTDGGAKVAEKMSRFLKSDYESASIGEERRKQVIGFVSCQHPDMDTITEFTASERTTIYNELGLSSFEPKKRNSKLKLFGILTEHLLGRAAVEYNAKSKRYKPSVRGMAVIYDLLKKSEAAG